MKLLCLIISFCFNNVCGGAKPRKITSYVRGKKWSKGACFSEKITTNTLLFSGASSSEDKSISLERIASLTFLPDESLSMIEKKLKKII